MIKQLKLTNDVSSAENGSEVGSVFAELEALVPKVKDISLSAKRSNSAPIADCSQEVVLCSSRF